MWSGKLALNAHAGRGGMFMHVIMVRSRSNSMRTWTVTTHHPVKSLAFVLPFPPPLIQGIICNWLVNLAVWMANSARDVTGARLVGAPGG